ncbi:MAG: translocation/assembly module TamB domain-containing protein, partial [Polaromonas sp.]
MDASHAPDEKAETPVAKPARRWLKAAAWAGGSVAVLAVAATGALWWWAGTDGSLATALRWIGQSQPLLAKNVSGSLRAGGHIDELHWLQNGLSVDARDVTLAWQPWSLLQGTLKLNRLAVASVTVNDQRPPTAAPATPPKALALPLSVELDDFSAGQFDMTGSTPLTARAISGNYRYNGLQHQLDLKGAQVASGLYNGRAVLTPNEPLTLDASLAGALAVALPDQKTLLPLSFQATAKGPLTELLVKAELQMATKPAAQGAKPAAQPRASASARVTPWAAQPLPQADATFRDLDLAALWPNAPQTLLTGSAHVQPLALAAANASPAWALQLQLANARPGPWDQKRLPIDSLDTQGEWRNGAALVRNLKARLGGGELLASGEWAESPKPATSDTAGSAWQLKATLKHISPALVHTQMGPEPLDGRADVQGQGALIRFDASAQTAQATVGAARAVRAARSGKNTLIEQLRLRQASATGSWNSQQAGGSLVLSALRVRTDDAELGGQLEVQPAERAGKGKLKLTAPGIEASVNGELRQSSGKGELGIKARDAAPALRWLQKLPGMPASMLAASASGSAELNASWQGGWLDPALQARLDVASLDWMAGSPKAADKAATPPDTTTEPATVATAASPGPLKIRALQATLSGRLSQAQFSAQGRVEMDRRRYALQLSADGGRVKLAGAPNAALAQSAWQGLLKQLSLSVEDPALGAGAWRLASKSTVPLRWTPGEAGGAFESGAGEAVLTAPAGKAPATSSAQALISWRPVRWRSGELITAGKLTGLPIAWLELLAGPQMAGAGLGGNLVFDGEWDAVLGNTLKFKASLARKSGDVTVQAEGVQGNTARVAAGVKQARLSIENIGDALTLALRWDSERAGTADGQIKTRLARAPEGQGVGGWLWPQDAPLSGQLRAQLPRIGVWSLLAPPGWRLRGSLATDLTVSGTRAAPRLAGELQANDLALRSVVDGIEFGNGRLRARLDGTRMRINEFTLQGAGEKGRGGTLTAQGEAGWIDGKPQVELAAKLQRLRASIRTDRQITVSGDVQASLKGRQAELSGKLVVDQARIMLPDEGTPQLGDDVLVRTASGAAAGQKAPAQTSNESADQASPPVKLALQLDLGRDFRIQGKGLDTRVRGSLALVGNSLREPRLTGTVTTFGGQYRAYGQRLDVEQGVLRFTGAVDNPTLDILAIRPNLTQRVGVQITGTALLPSVRLYAQPELP